MRRVPASLLIALFSFSLIVPALSASGPYAKLPACCRRAGKHHCEMMAAQLASSGPALQKERCALFPSLKTGPATVSSIGGIQVTRFGVTMARRVIRTHTVSLCHSSYSRAGQKRGPPTPIA